VELKAQAMMPSEIAQYARGLRIAARRMADIDFFDAVIELAAVHNIPPVAPTQQPHLSVATTLCPVCAEPMGRRRPISSAVI
jgi:hypothetical protein